MELTIAHLTDTHIAPTAELVRDIDVRHHFEIILQDIIQARPDLIVLGGDQAARNGEVEAYEWIHPRLEQTAIPFCLIPGNHDNITNMTTVFDIKQEQSGDALYFSKKVKGMTLFFLDSSKAVVAPEQLDWLEREAGRLSGSALLFIHHPPLFCNCSFMDTRYPLKNRETVFEVIGRISAIEHIFCGHYHTEKTIRDSGKNIYLTPSTMLQMDPSTSEYSVSGTAPGWRFIRWNGQRLETSVHYILPA